MFLRHQNSEGYDRIPQGRVSHTFCVAGRKTTSKTLVHTYVAKKALGEKLDLLLYKWTQTNSNSKVNINVI